MIETFVAQIPCKHKNRIFREFLRSFLEKKRICSRGVASPKTLGWENEGSGGKPLEKFFVTTPFRLSENVGNALNYLENFGKAALSSSILRNSGHSCRNENRIEVQHHIIHVTIYKEGKDTK